MRKYLALILTAITGFAVAETQNLSLDKLPENVAPAYTNPHKDIGNIPVTFLINRRLFRIVFVVYK